MQHINSKAQFYSRKVGDYLYFAIFSPTYITYIAQYLLSTDDKYSMQHYHTWAEEQCVE